MFFIFRGLRPDVTAIQAGATIVAALPSIATLLAGLGVLDVTRRQRDLLRLVLICNVAFAGLLVVADVLLRISRNFADAKCQVAAMEKSAFSAAVPAAEEDLTDEP